MTEDLVVAEKLVEAGSGMLMPWGAPIGSGRGLNNVFGLGRYARISRNPADRRRRHRLPSHAAATMELGYDAVLLDTAVAKAAIPRDGADGAGHRSRSHGVSRPPYGAAGHRRPLDAGAGEGDLS